MADGGGHPAHLAVAPFARWSASASKSGTVLRYADRRVARPQLRIGHPLCLGGPREPVPQLDAASQAFQVGFVGLAFDLDEDMSWAA
jgi:hypothetical protein